MYVYQGSLYGLDLNLSALYALIGAGFYSQ